MSTKAEQVADLINNLNVKTKEIGAGDFLVGSLPTPGVAVADAAGTAPTAAEFKALLDSLRNSGAIAQA